VRRYRPCCPPLPRCRHCRLQHPRRSHAHDTLVCTLLAYLQRLLLGSLVVRRSEVGRAHQQPGAKHPVKFRRPLQVPNIRFSTMRRRRRSI
jgi:hypothetical protein